jgi:hypothetical protein
MPDPRYWEWRRAGLVGRTTFAGGPIHQLGLDASWTRGPFELGSLFAYGIGAGAVDPSPRPSYGPDDWTAMFESQITLGVSPARWVVSDAAVVPALQLGLATADYVVGERSRRFGFVELGPVIGGTLDLWTLRRGHGQLSGWGLRLAVTDRIQAYRIEGLGRAVHRPTVSLTAQAVAGHRWRRRVPPLTEGG